MKACIGVFLFFFLLISPVYSQTKASEKAYKKAISYFNKEKSGEGFAWLQKSVQADSTNKKALYALGYYRFQAHEYEQARGAFDRLIRLYPKDTSFYHYRALTHLYTDNYSAAEKDFKQALALDGNDETTWNDLGYLYYQWGKNSEAAAALDRSVAIKPSRAAWYYKALLAYNLDDRKTAQENLQKALQLDPAYANGLRLKATFLAENKKYTEAAQIYEGLLKTGDIEDDDFLDWGLLYYRQKKYEDALYYFTLPDSTNDLNLLYYTGLTQYRLKKYPEALQLLTRATQQVDSTDEANAPVLYDRSIVRFQASDRKGALKDFFHAVYLMPEIVQQKNQEGDTLELLGNAAQLLNRMYTTAQLDSVRLLGYYDRVEALLETGNMSEDVLPAANQVVALDSAHSDAYFLRARVYYFQGKYAEALRDLNKVLELRKNNATSYEHYWRGLVYSAMDAYENALQDYASAIQKDPDEPAYYADRALALSVIGETTDALTDINRAIELEKQDDTTYLVLIRASMLNDDGQYTQALKDCEVVIARQPDNALAYCMRGYAHLGLKHTTQAMADFTKALSLDPDMDEAKAGLEEMEGQ